MSAVISTIVYSLLAVKFHTVFSSTSASVKSMRDKATNTVSSFLTQMEQLYAEKFDDELSDEAVEYAYARKYAHASVYLFLRDGIPIADDSRYSWLVLQPIVILDIVQFAQNVRPFSMYLMSSSMGFGQRSWQRLCLRQRYLHIRS